MVISAVARAPGTGAALAQLRVGGRVRSAHRRVLNLESAAGRLLALHTRDVPHTPFSIVLEALPGSRWPSVGAEARIDGGLLRVGELEVLLRGCTVLPEAVRSASDIGDMAIARSALGTWAEASAFGAWWAPAPRLASGLDARIAAQGRSALERLVAEVSTQSARRETLQRVVDELMGLGYGSTPSGDDCLLGFTAAWLRFGPDSARAAGFARLQAEQAPIRTTRLAAEFFHHLAAGRVSQLVNALLDSLTSADRRMIAQASACLASYGASSGRDTISGIHAFVLVRGAKSPP